MKILNLEKQGRAAIVAQLTKAAFDEVELNPKIRAANQALFGEDLSAAEVVERIVNDVRQEGDAAVQKYTHLFDQTDLTPKDFLVSESEYAEASRIADPEILDSLRRAAANIYRYHKEQKPNSWMTYREAGSILGQSVIPLDRVGIYVPGGTAAYPSSVLMNAIPAKVAGVKELIMMVPPKKGQINPYVLLMAREIGVNKIYKIGGAQAIAAMAFGTQTIPRVDKITGPGNLFVTLAKRQFTAIAISICSLAPVRF